ncbi:replication-relaxation family protein [Ectobacillus panaciterrae]|uniref:replication-relaxation family protein n=1 Tax=Ectobacillus panaciterrae TaxID=363872 RepID=UPI00040A8C55|nr:replication-relaxation family protein [Ectobacillus panaciterrae]
MNKRDKQIIDDITRFRALSRDQIIALHFSKLKKPTSNCNLVLKRLQDRQYIKACKDFTPYVYIPYESRMKENSQKIWHFLKIADTFIELKKYDAELSYTLIEPKMGEKGVIEPDLFVIFKKTPMFFEIQRTIYSEKIMQEKIMRYEQYYLSNDWQNLEWQRQDKKFFPAIILLTDTRYNIETVNLKVIQVPSVKALVNTFSPMKEPSVQQNQKEQIINGVKIKFGY